MLLLLVLVVILFRSQMKFARPSRLRYWLIPIYTMWMLITTFSFSKRNLQLFIVVGILAMLVSIFQAYFTKIKEFIGTGGEPRVEVKGGWAYIVGWILIFGLQFAIEMLVEHYPGNLTKELTSGLIEEWLPWAKVQGNSPWVLWELSAISSLGYTLILMLRSSAFRLTIQRHARKKDRTSLDQK